jgi:hypothetical protein
VDLMAEAVPHGKAELHWHFTMDEQPPADEIDADLLLDHAKQLRAATDQNATEAAPEPTE